MRFLALLIAALTACAAQAQDTIKIGVITDRVGVSKPYSEPATEGMVFGASEINKKGGVLGRKIELLVEDDQSKPDVSAALARKLIDQGAVFILSVSLRPGDPAAANGDDGGEDAADDADELGRLPHHPAQQPVLLADRSVGLGADRHAARAREEQESKARRAHHRQLGARPGDRQGVPRRDREGRHPDRRRRGRAARHDERHGADAEKFAARIPMLCSWRAS